MALSQAQWFAKLKSWVPTWFVQESSGYAVAHMKALAKVLSQMQTDSEDETSQTFLLEATGSYLDLHGSERGVIRYSGETDDAYRERIRYLLNTTSYSSLLAVLTAALNNGTPRIIENRNYGFFDDALFFDSGEIWLDKTKWWNWLTVLIPAQNVNDHATIRAAIVQLMNRNKALGVTYDVAFDTEGDTLLTEQGDELTTEDGEPIINEQG